MKDGVDPADISSRRNPDKDNAECDGGRGEREVKMWRTVRRRKDKRRENKRWLSLAITMP
jgi:hypothetical protein